MFDIVVLSECCCVVLSMFCVGVLLLVLLLVCGVVGVGDVDVIVVLW